MTKKVYRTAQGKIVDLGALQLRNENIRAVGNMSVNARGDLVDSNNSPIKTRNQEVKRQYNRQTTQGTDTRPGPRVSRPKVDIPTPPEDFEDDFEKTALPEVKSAPAESQASESAPSGLAAAIAKARQVKQDPLRTPREVAQMQEGVKKI